MNTEEENSTKAVKYNIILDSHAERDFDDLPPADARRIEQRILSLEENPRPRGAKKLGENYYRIRVGPWRIIYVVIDKDRIVTISRIKRREKNTYRRGL